MRVRVFFTEPTSASVSSGLSLSRWPGKWRKRRQPETAGRCNEAYGRTWAFGGTATDTGTPKA